MRDVLVTETTATKLGQKIAPVYVTITTAIAVAGLLVAVSLPQKPGELRTEGDEQAIAEHYAPVWYQDARLDSGSLGYKPDYLTRMDFDGIWEMDEKWENMPNYPLPAYIYFSVIKTATHWYLTYADYHPRDWDGNGCTSLRCHENDLEGAQLVVRRDGSEYGRLEIIETIYHDTTHKFYDPAAVVPRSGITAEPILYVDANGRPLLFIASEGHPVDIRPSVTVGDGHFEGIYDPDPSRPECLDGTYGSTGDGLVYRYSDGAGEVPSSYLCGDRDVSYGLLSLEDELWSRRTWYDNNGHDKVYDDADHYTGDRYSLPDLLGTSFNGDDYGDDKANPPWSWGSWPVQVGDWAIDPAHTMQSHFTFFGPIDDQYEQNFYLFNAAGDEDINITSENASQYFHVSTPDPSDIGTNSDCEYNNSNKWCQEGDGDPVGELHWTQHLLGCYEVSDDDRPGSEDCRYDDSHSNTLTYEWNSSQPQRAAEQIARIILVVNTRSSACAGESGYENDDGLDYGTQVVELHPDSDPNKHWKFQKCTTGGSHGPMQFRALFDGNNIFAGIEVRMGDHYDEGTMRVEGAYVNLNRCNDGTVYGQCSATKPYKCVSGALVSRCLECGCPGAQSCNSQDGSCAQPGGSPIFYKDFPASQEGRIGE